MSDADSTNNNGGTNGLGGELTGIPDRTLNQVFDVLASQRCRYTVHALRQTSDDVVSLQTLSASILTHDPDATDGDRVQMHLHHQTLPRLAEAHIIDYDPRTHTVRYHGDELLDDILDSL